MTRLRVSSAAEHTLDRWLDAVMQGQLPLAELPLCVAAWFHAGAAYGRADRQIEIDALEREVQRLHYLAFHSPGERREQLLARLDEGLATADEVTWERLEKDLREIAGRQLNSSNVDLETRETPEIESRNDGNRNAPGVQREAA